jgi:hypothetical protein
MAIYRQLSSVVVSRYNTDVAFRHVFLLCFLLSSMVSVRAQQAKVIDLSTVQQRTTLRIPQAKEPNCVPQPCVVTKETSFGDCTDAVRGLHVALDRVTPSHITLDPFEAEFRILNTGSSPIEVPISPELSELQPPGELQNFSYVSLALLVRLHAAGPAQAAGMGWIELYGSAEHSETILALEPGHWIRVTAKVKLHTWPSQPVEALLRGDFLMHKNLFKPEEHGGFIDAEDLCPNRTTLSDTVEVYFSPIHSGAQQPQAAKP